jgi:hypothetical protein
MRKDDASVASAPGQAGDRVRKGPGFVQGQALNAAPLVPTRHLGRHLESWLSCVRASVTPLPKHSLSAEETALAGIMSRSKPIFSCLNGSLDD